MKPGDTYSKRRKAAEQGATPEVYEYDDLAQPFRVQVVHILIDALGRPSQPDPYRSGAVKASKEWWQAIHDRAAREVGKLRLGDLRSLGPDGVCIHYLTEGAETRGPGKGRPNTDEVLDFIEIAFGFLPEARRSLGVYDDARGLMLPKQAVDELNLRFREHALGYQFVGDRIVRIDSLYIHSEVVVQALSLLQSPHFRGPEEEFREAHRQYREGNAKQAIVEALKAFESTLKAICQLHGWKYVVTDSAKQLIALVLEKGLVPSSMTSYIANVRAVLESGLPTLRNREAGHGQGPEVVEVPDYYAPFALHLAATTIVFLVEAHQAFKKPTT